MPFTNTKQNYFSMQKYHLLFLFMSSMFLKQRIPVKFTSNVLIKKLYSHIHRKVHFNFQIELG